MTSAKKVLTRKIEINGQEFTVFGEAPWTVIPVDAVRNLPACHIIIEASLLSLALYNNKHMYNALSTKSKTGANIGVAFTGDSGLSRANEIVRKLNFKF